MKKVLFSIAIAFAFCMSCFAQPGVSISNTVGQGHSISNTDISGYANYSSQSNGLIESKVCDSNGIDYRKEVYSSYTDNHDTISGFSTGRSHYTMANHTAGEISTNVGTVSGSSFGKLRIHSEGDSYTEGNFINLTKTSTSYEFEKGNFQSSSGFDNVTRTARWDNYETNYTNVDWNY